MPKSLASVLIWEIDGPDSSVGDGDVVALAGAIVGDRQRVAGLGRRFCFGSAGGCSKGIHRANLTTSNYTPKQQLAETAREADSE